MEFNMNNVKQYNLHSVRNILSDHGIKPSKSMGQNFLIDPNIPVKIVKQSEINSSCCVLEVGPGLGALTAELSKAACRVIAVELDKRLVPILQDMFDNQSNVKIVQGDILKINIKSLFENINPELKFNVCANLPYNITTPAITAFIEAEIFDSITVMVQKEVAQRICANPGTPEYGAFTVFVNYFTSPEKLFDISSECFSPRPNVVSSVINMQVKKEKTLSESEEKQLFKLVRAAFNQRRKTLVNALSATYNETHTKESLTKVIENCGFNARIRGEVLNLDNFISLSQLL